MMDPVALELLRSTDERLRQIYEYADMNCGHQPSGFCLDCFVASVKKHRIHPRSRKPRSR